MKILKNISFLISVLLSFISNAVLAAAGLWYILPDIRSIPLFQEYLALISPTLMPWILGVSAGLSLLTLILRKLLAKNMSSKIQNLFVHLSTWIIGLGLLGAIMYTFINTTPMITQAIVITEATKIGIGMILGSLFVFHIVSSKVNLFINRKLQAYDTAKEMNTVARGSIIFVNLLKLINIIFPEGLILALVCLLVSWNISSYFILVLGAALIPVLGNIEADFNIKKEINRKKDAEKDDLAKNVARQLKGVR